MSDSAMQSAAAPARQTRSGPPDTDQRAIVRTARARLLGPDEPSGTSPESRGHQLVCLAEQPVDPRIDIPARCLDRPVGVDHQRVTWPERALLGGCPAPQVCIAGREELAAWHRAEQPAERAG